MFSKDFRLQEVTKPSEVVSFEGTKIWGGQEYSLRDIVVSKIGLYDREVLAIRRSGKTLGYFSAFVPRAGVYELEIQLLPSLDKVEKLWVGRNAREFVKYLKEGALGQDFFCIQMACEEKFCRWAEFLGLEYSYSIDKYDGKDTYYVYRGFVCQQAEAHQPSQVWQVVQQP